MIKELKSFEFENLGRQNVSQIDFEPRLNLMAVSLVQNFTFEERIDVSGCSYDSSILLWNYEEFHRFVPLATLGSSSEFTCFRFKPDNPHFLVTGTINGQVLLYDIRTLFDLGSPDSEENIQKDNRDIKFFEPVLTSQVIESFNANQVLIQKEVFSKKQIYLVSHRSPVVSLEFLP